MNPRATARILLGISYGLAGYFHLAAPAPFLSIMPHWVPAQGPVVLWTGIAEILGAAALVQPWNLSVRKAGAAGLALYAICVFPANINHFILDLAKPDHGLGMAYHVPRMIAQPLIVWLTLWSTRLIGWPLRSR